MNQQSVLRATTTTTTTTKMEIQYLEKITATLEEKTLMQYGQNLITKPLNNQPIVKNNEELGFEILKSRVNCEQKTHPKKMSHHQQPIVDQQQCKQAIERRQRTYETKRRINNEETVAEYIAAKRQVKRIVKQEKSK